MSLDSPETSNTHKDTKEICVPPSPTWSNVPPRTRIIAIGMQAHKKFKIEPFAYVFHHLVEQRNCKVVVICCLSRIQDEMGVDHQVDIDAFLGVNEARLQIAINTLKNNLEHFLRVFREKLTQRGVQLEIQVLPGAVSHNVLVQAAKAFGAYWVVLDSSFSGQKLAIQAALNCNLVLMNGTEIELLRITPTHSASVDQIIEVDPRDYHSIQRRGFTNILTRIIKKGFCCISSGE